MPNLLEKFPWMKLSRRSFLAAGAAGFASATLAGCASRAQSQLSETGEGNSAPFESEGRWIPAACWMNCGGKCYNAAYVVDGVVRYQKTDDLSEDSWEEPQQRGCVRGRSLRHMVYSESRIKYPMKRRHWSPDNPHKELRGKDEWERISWDEALDYVADQLKAAIAKDGARSIFATKSMISSSFWETMNAIGGFTDVYDTASMGSYARTNAQVGLPVADLGGGSDRLDLLKSETVVLYGCNPVWASPGQPNFFLRKMKEAGVKFIYVGPSHNATADLLDATWLPVRPATDMAFMLAVAHVMITEDDPKDNPLIDWDFLERCTVGFDGEHLPEGAAGDENFRDYVLGNVDGVAKTPEWASRICGTPVEDIQWFAREIGCTHDVAMLHSYAPARCNDAEDVPQMFMTLSAMGGHFGKEGNQCASIYHANAANNGPALIVPGETGQLASVNPVDDQINGIWLWESIINGKYLYLAPLLSGGAAPEERDLRINVIYHAMRNTLQTVHDVQKGIEAHRTVDFVVTQGFEFNMSAQYSDILLPVKTQWEKFSTYGYLTMTGRDFQLFPSRVIDPLWEAKSDEEIGIELLKRFDIDPDTVYPVREEQAYFNFILGATYAAEDGTYKPLVTITQEEIDELGFEGEPQEGAISYRELMERGKYQVPRREGDGWGCIGFKEYRDDPEGNPRATASGKLEIHSQAKADVVNAIGLSTLKPYPTYRPTLLGYEESFEDFEAGIKGPYPYQMYNPHYLRRSHTCFDDVAQLREVWPNPVYINASDAREKGVETGDDVLVYHATAKCLRKACVTERIMPGVLALPHGTWCDLDEAEGIDRSGSDNWMLAGVGSASGVSGYNSNLVNFEKWTGEPLQEDRLRQFGPVGGIE